MANGSCQHCALISTLEPIKTERIMFISRLFAAVNVVSLVFVLSVGALLPVSCAHAAVITPVDIDRTEGRRHYLFAAPDHLLPGKHPLVILLHGHGGNAAQLLGQQKTAAPMSLWLKIADREQWLVVAADGLKGSDGKAGWNDCRSDAVTSPKVDDTGFINAIIDREIAQHDADPTRIYVMGMSNGGIMSFRLANDIGHRLGAFAAVSASMASQSLCEPPKSPISALIVSGTGDPLVPYGGGEIRFISLQGRGSVVGIEESASFWRKIDQISDSPQATELPHLDAKDTTHATRILWGADPSKLQVELLKIDGGGHIEPSITERPHAMYTMIVGPQNGDLEIAEEAWRFFKDKRAGLTP
jgi:polyhydroxybutyrate depolymerase